MPSRPVGWGGFSAGFAGVLYPRAMLCLYGPPSEIALGHHQSGYPLTDPVASGFDVVVLCARELQPEKIGRAKLVHAPMDDDLITDEIIQTATTAALLAKDFMDQGLNVLVSCLAGKNRSGLVSGLILCDRFGMSGTEAVSQIKKQRPIALTNESFTEYLNSIR